MQLPSVGSKYYPCHLHQTTSRTVYFGMEGVLIGLDNLELDYIVYLPSRKGSHLLVY